MSSNLMFHHNFIDSIHEHQIAQKHLNGFEMLHQPVERIGQIINTETEIIATIKDSLNLQSESFDFKYNTFKELIQEFTIKIDQDQLEMFQMFGVNDDPHVKPQKSKIPQIPQPISEKNDSNSFEDSAVHNSNNSRYIKPEKAVVRGRKPKLATQAQNTQENGTNEPISQAIERRMKKPIRYGESEDKSESGNSQNDQGHKNQKNDKIIKQKFSIQSKGPNKYKITRQRLQNTIKNNGKIANHFNRIGEIFLHPYSTLQMLLDYNESIDYPLVKAKREELVNGDESD